MTPSQQPKVAWYDYVLRFMASAYVAKIILMDLNLIKVY